MKSIDFFTLLIIFQVFFSVGINIYQEIIPDNAKTYVGNILGVDIISVSFIQSELESSLTQQTNMPVVDLAALAFYSGNIILDLILNFVFAIPQCATVIFEGLMLMFNISSSTMIQMQSFVFVIFFTLYFIGVIKLLTNVRTGVIQ